MDAQTKPASAAAAADQLWYKDAIIFQLHVKSFFDSNDDGIGDFPGLISKLDYIAELGANTIWLLPFYPSPRLDDGYDISEYRDVHRDYGTLADFRQFIRQAHARGIRVITELVVNHTSDQHPWFQRARRAKPGSPWRDYYVWSDTDQKYAGTRIIFVDTERSNWTWDPVAGAYYWHRFYSHQPDLNFDNPQVLKAVLGVMRFWLRLGVDGLRLDAVPYLIEREGTNNENLPETHAILKKFRAEVDRAFPGRMLLAEVNQWPEDTKDYFGDGDECHMAFHFPLMPRMYMAIAREDRFPISDIMRQTPPIPDSCQWAVFLRNHDELTLEMVTDSERDYLWQTYASDRRARLNLGIRRRLAPLLERDRRRIELMNSLLLSMPGTPVIYYGDEIAMGDNIHLGDRNGVRTPMQWTPDRNGGFSRADPAALVLPPIMDPLYGYGAVNVEAQSRDPHSVLNWTRRMLAVRSRHPAFGRGTLTLLYPKNRKILAYLREYRGDILLCVANVAHSPQAVELDLSRFVGRVPVELNAGTLFPPIGELTYLLTLPPYGFYWFALAPASDWPSWHTPAPEPLPEFVTIVMRDGLAKALSSDGRALIEDEALPQYIAKRRWFGLKDQIIRSARIANVTDIGDGDREILLAEVEVKTDAASRWFLPMSILWEDEPSAALPHRLALARVRRGRRLGFLTDAFALPSLAYRFVDALAAGREFKNAEGVLHFRPTASGKELLRAAADENVNWLSAEQSNSSLTIGDMVMLKIFRRISAGQHPETEMSRYLTAQGFANAPPLLGEVVQGAPDGTPNTLAVALGFIRNQGDAWTWMLDQLTRALDSLSPNESEFDMLSDCEAVAAAIGRRLGEMHAVLARRTADEAFAPTTATAEDAAGWTRKTEQRLDKAFSALEKVRDWTGEQDRDRVKALLSQRARLTAAVKNLAKGGAGTLMIRIHGDFHLGQVLVASGDAYIIDFEGEPATSIAERRAKTSPLRDVAGLLRSIDYAGATLIEGKGVSTAPIDEAQRDRLIAEFRTRASRAFLKEYWAGRHFGGGAAERTLLELFLIEKAAYEVIYEAANRPTWLTVPVAGLSRLVKRIVDRDAGHG
ncbi:MAG TPA: maltose alpha-D-glucosyltransferase [Xanthobacteraceae bacterium]|nr:maltose alpha-D-glucosyltransferase [Xanthobacteraceae bacterium]